MIPVDINLTGDRASDSGCTADDFAGLDFSGDSDIALIQRGTCGFANKSRNAEDAGAEAVIIFNQGNAEDRLDLIVGTAANLDDGDGPSNLTIPVVGASFADGEALAQAGSTAFVEVLEPEIREDFNVIAEKPGDERRQRRDGRRPPRLRRGRSGHQRQRVRLRRRCSSLAQKMSKVDNVRTPSASRGGPARSRGSSGPPTTSPGCRRPSVDRIASYLNFDMIGSPNFIYGVYDADESSFPAPAGVPIPDGSIALEDLFEIYFTWQGIPYEDSEFSGRSDYQAFIQNGIPASGLFTGAEVPKTEEQEAIWEGVAGEAYDPCYHQACDSLDPTHPDRDPAVYDELDAENDLVGNLSLEALGVNADAIAFAMLTLAYSTEDVNGVPGEPVPGSRLAGPAGRAGRSGGHRRLRRRPPARPRAAGRLTHRTTPAERRSPAGEAGAPARAGRVDESFAAGGIDPGQQVLNWYKVQLTTPRRTPTHEHRLRPQHHRHRRHHRRLRHRRLPLAARLHRPPRHGDQGARPVRRVRGHRPRRHRQPRRLLDRADHHPRLDQHRQPGPRRPPPLGRLLRRRAVPAPGPSAPPRSPATARPGP